MLAVKSWLPVDEESVEVAAEATGPPGDVWQPGESVGEWPAGEVPAGNVHMRLGPLELVRYSRQCLPPIDQDRRR